MRGTLDQSNDAGATVRLLLVTPAGKGSHDLTASPADIAVRREGETERSAHLLGVTDIAFLRHTDGEVECSRAVPGKMVHRMRWWRLEVIFTHDQEQPLPPYLAPATIAPSIVDAWMPSIQWPRSSFLREQFAAEARSHATADRTSMALRHASAIAATCVDVSNGSGRKITARFARAYDAITPNR